MLTPPTELSFLVLARQREHRERVVYHDIFGHPMLLRACGPPPFFLVRVTLVPEADGAYWGWWDPKDNRIHHIYPARMLLDICFDFHTQLEEERNHGRVVRCVVEPVRQLTAAETALDGGEQIEELRAAS